MGDILDQSEFKSIDQMSKNHKEKKNLKPMYFRYQI